MKKVNVKLLALKYLIAEKLKKSIENDKKALKDGAETTFSKCADIHIIECTRYSYTKEDSEKLDKIAKTLGIEKQPTYYKRVDITNIDKDIQDKTDKAIALLETSTDDKTTQKVMQAIA